MYGFEYGADRTGRAVYNRFVVYHQALWTGEWRTKLLGVVCHVYYEAYEGVFPSLLVKLERKRSYASSSTI